MPKYCGDLFNFPVLHFIFIERFDEIASELEWWPWLWVDLIDLLLAFSFEFLDLLILFLDNLVLLFPICFKS